MPGSTHCARAAIGSARRPTCVARRVLAGDDEARTAGYLELLLIRRSRRSSSRARYGASRLLHGSTARRRAATRRSTSAVRPTALFAFSARGAPGAFYGPMVAVEMAGPRALDGRRS